MPRDLREALKGQLSDDELRQFRAFDVIGDIAVVKLPEKLLSKKHLIGQALMQVHRHVRTVLNQTAPVRGEFRTRELEVIAGEPRTETVYHEGGCIFKVDLAKAYFSPRLATERLRVAKLVRLGEVVTNLFAGVGSYSIIIARHSKAARVYSIDKNPAAFEYMRENIRINKVGDRVVPILGDAREVVEKRFARKADRVLMPLPELAHDFFDVALEALKPSGGIVHLYDFGQEPDVFGPSFEFARSAAAQKGFKVDLLGARKIRSYATRCHHVVLDLALSSSRKI
ncbi:MAG: class I SAM-dependent methyltransferase family protein [Candidatus Hodarchaeaceae archaeon]|nr:class I SAM-dependent methyltransferase family protein [Candidatus Hodarchaeaceae archaeon]